MVAIIGIIVVSSVVDTMAANGHDNRNKIRINYNGNTIMRDGSNRPMAADTKASSEQRRYNADDDVMAGRSDEANDFVSIEVDDQLSLKDQMHALTRQMSKMFQHEWKVTMRKAAKELLEADFQSQLEQLR